MKVLRYCFVLVLVFSCSSQLYANLENIQEQLDLIANPNTPNVARRKALMTLEELRRGWKEAETFDSQIGYLKPQLIAAAKVVAEEFLPECVCPGFCIVRSVGLGRGIVPIFSFFAHWSIAKEDIEDELYRVGYGISLAKTFPDWLDFGKAQPLLPKLTEKFGEANAYDLSVYSSWKIQLLKVAVDLNDNPYMSAAFNVGGLAVTVGMIGMCFYSASLVAEYTKSMGI